MKERQALLPLLLASASRVCLPGPTPTPASPLGLNQSINLPAAALTCAATACNVGVRWPWELTNQHVLCVCVYAGVRQGWKKAEEQLKADACKAEEGRAALEAKIAEER